MVIMRKQLLITILFFAAATAAAQELLVPLELPPVPSAIRPALKQNAEPVKLPFFDDFSDYQGYPKQSHWVDEQAFVGSDYGQNPPTIGMMTLDAIGADGKLHAGASVDLFSGDTATSAAIRLDSIFGDSTWVASAADSLVFSFFYLPGGGSGSELERTQGRPSEIDSLFLEFYKPQTDEWVCVWSRGGISVDSLIARTGHAWQYVAIAITDDGYLDSAFRFRFRNYCSLNNSTKPGRAGNCDHWNIDYVYLDRSRSVLDTTFDDVAFVNPAPSMLSHYRAMPARQFRTSDMAQSLQMTITNLYSTPITTHYGYDVYDENGNHIDGYNGGDQNAPPFRVTGTYQQATAHANPPVNFSFATGNAPRSYTIIHVVREGLGDGNPQNDTTVFRQIFDNYFAYDDGTPEGGYGLSTTGKLANRFDLNVADTLTALDLYFNRTRNGENELIPFRIIVWANNNGVPGEELYRDSQRRYPQFAGLNKYHRYVLENPVVISGSVFIGFEQLNGNFINIGFDRTFNTASRRFCLYGTEWEPSLYSGSIMLRPCFGQAATVSISQPMQLNVSVFPSPVSDVLNIVGLPDGCTVTLIDMVGRQCFTGRDAARIDVSYLPCGIYLLRVVDKKNNAVGTTKIAISR